MTHFSTDVCPVLITFLVHQFGDALFNCFHLSIDCRLVPTFEFFSAFHCVFTRYATKYHKLSQ
eukprot:m.343027 g.343027  ORF g.343027 m.343027 type:complete len:63 (-) comp175471_c0_seq1:92-280(-)